MRFLSKKSYRYLIFIVLGVIVVYLLYTSQTHKPDTPDTSTTKPFVFPQENTHSFNKTMPERATWQLFIDKEEMDIDFVKFAGDNNSSLQRPLPAPRSHVTTASSHVIAQFVRDIGCARKNKHGLMHQYLKILIVCFDKTQQSVCHSWTWDPANWTLILSDEKEQSNVYDSYRICSYPKITKRVDRIVYPNGTEDLPGCTFHRSPCSVVEPYFDKVLNMRINWSPCCRRMMLDMLSAAHDVFENHNVRYVLIGGAVISVARENGNLIPYDTDLDIMVDKRDRAKFNNQTATDMAALGYHYQWKKQGSYIRICVNKICDAHIDVWFYEKDPRSRHKIKYFTMWFWSIREEFLFPTSWILFEGKKYRFPRKILKYLSHEYSSGLIAGYRNWKQVLLCNFKRGRKCTFYSE